MHEGNGYEIYTYCTYVHDMIWVRTGGISNSDVNVSQVMNAYAWHYSGLNYSPNERYDIIIFYYYNYHTVCHTRVRSKVHTRVTNNSVFNDNIIAMYHTWGVRRVRGQGLEWLFPGGWGMGERFLKVKNIRELWVNMYSHNV